MRYEHETFGVLRKILRRQKRNRREVAMLNQNKFLTLLSYG